MSAAADPALLENKARDPAAEQQAAIDPDRVRRGNLRVANSHQSSIRSVENGAMVSCDRLALFFFGGPRLRALPGI